MSTASPVDWALAYARHGLLIFPANAAKEPLTANGFKDASTDSAVLVAWWSRWRFAEPAWALPETVVVIDLDIKRGKNGYRDFERRDGHDPRDVGTPATTTPSGGMQLFYAASRTYQNRVAIDGTGIDTRSKGGYVVLPSHQNGRQWIRRLRETPMARAPAWLDAALKRAPAPVVLMRPIESREQALTALERACARIIAAQRGARDDTRHRSCFYVGALIKRGELDYATGLSACQRAAHAMVGSNDFRNLDDRVETSIRRGMERAS
jgi:hypothetical protein